MLWLYLLAIVTCLVIVLRRVMRRLTPLDDELYSKKVAIEYVYTGVAWVDAEGRVGSINPALERSLGLEQSSLKGRNWLDIFVPAERDRVREAYSQMLLAGKTAFQARGLRADGRFAQFDILLVAVHDHKMRFVGHHILAEDRTRERELEERLEKLSSSFQ
jgi:PAS domain S-box-containing protein